MLALVTLAALASQALAHGILTWPITRALPQDQQDGYTYAMGAINVALGPHPDFDKLCNYLPPGPIFTQDLVGGPAVIDYNIMNAHQGGCNVYISKDSQKTWQLIGSDPKCGVAPETSSKQGSINVTIPAGNYNAVIRWSYVAKNGGQPEEEAFGGCADVRVSSTGNNQHSSYLLLSQSAPSELPKTPGSYFDQSCKAGSFVCSDNTAFINQCISLGPSGGFNGGSSWYEYQCPFGTTCKTDNGVGACVGAGSPSPVLTTTVAPTTTTTTTTTTAVPTTTTTTTTTTVAPTTTTTTTTVAPTTTTTTTTTAASTTTAAPTTTTTTTTTVAPTTTTTTTTTIAPTTTTTTTTAAPTTTTTDPTTTTTVAPTTTTTSTTTDAPQTTTTTTADSSSTIADGVSCSTYGAWGCSYACTCNYVAGNVLQWQCPTKATC
ncbi:hypothetical protein BDR26DRAFT_989134 [Obelidium mucronatum]|nr:hypothetical protein BDR26DRAFT_989134 [Obelidium mucronatum]